MKQATVIIPFLDLVEDISREAGDVFSCSDERAEYLVSIGVIRAEDKPKPKQTRKKKEA